MAKITEEYKPIVVGANSTVTIHGKAVGGFFCTANGTFSLVRNNGGSTTTLINGVACTAGTFYRLPFYLGIHGGTFTTASDATGVLGVV